MKVEISNGELLDKLSILQIKKERMIDPSKLHNVLTEYQLLEELSDELLSNPAVVEEYNVLINVNEQLWEIEDKIRDKEHNKTFDEEFVQLARQVYITNDKRAIIKRRINELTHSTLIEEKSYAKYEHT